MIFDDNFDSHASIKQAEDECKRATMSAIGQLVTLLHQLHHKIEWTQRAIQEAEAKVAELTEENRALRDAVVAKVLASK